MQLAHPHLGPLRLDPLKQKAVAWRIADLCVLHLLSEEERRWARTGSPEPLDPFLGFVLPLPSERATCIESLTWAEMVVARRCLNATESPLLDVLYPIGAASWWVISQRLTASFDHPDRPLSDQYLQTELAALDDIKWEVDGQYPAAGFR